ncbi:phytase [Mucilaginibacter pedocola]|uniref:3-phytase n=1 Tax=Mucilaginibacter pedocola TaxID=1792845 RepID=A0A1S9P8Q9_9SPHI|nr:phytase [Mucilaginibacter pedocola]OOQ57322.1 3-phytase [Mucilaginibacter pedocola]
MRKGISGIIIATGLAAASCQSPSPAQKTTGATADTIVKPLYVTEPVQFDTDDPAIWVNPANPAQSLVIGTDKDTNGGLYVFDLKGKIVKDKVVTGLQRPNNVDIAYGLMLNGKPVDIAVATERITHKLRIFSLPDMKPVDNGGIPVFEGENEAAGLRDLMGISLYTAPDKQIYAIVGRKTGPTNGGYLWQYLLQDDGTGHIKATLKRKFGQYSGKKEIEAIAVDNQMGYVYYSDEQFGVRKYYADPDKGNAELNLFGQTGFAEDHEGISIYKTGDTTGYVLVSDQSAGQFKVFTREGNNAFVKSVHVSTSNSDGSDVVSVPLNDDFKHGLFVAMSDDKTFQFYRWEDIAGKSLKVNK